MIKYSLISNSRYIMKWMAVSIGRIRVISRLLPLWIHISVPCVCAIILYLNMTRILKSLFPSLMDGI